MLGRLFNYICRLQSRLHILKIHSRKMNLMRGIDLRKIASQMNGSSGAESKVCDFNGSLSTFYLFSDYVGVADQVHTWFGKSTW